MGCNVVKQHKHSECDKYFFKAKDMHASGDDW